MRVAFLYNKVNSKLCTPFKSGIANLSTFVKEMSMEGVQPFENIPGPIRLPFIGSLYVYKIPGGYNIAEYHKVLHKLHEKYGPIVREDRGKQIIIHVFDPEDVKTVFSYEGKNPVIPPLQEVTQMYRQKRQMSLGLGNTNGEEWYRLRSAVHKMMLRPKEVYYYLPLVDNVAKSFVEKIDKSLDENGQSPDLRNLVAKWILESAGMVCFEKRLGSLDENENLANKLIQANKEIFTLAGQLKFALPFYKYIMTPRWKRFLDAEDFFYSHASRFVEETIAKISDLSKNNQLKENQFNFLNYLLSRKELTQKDVLIITLSLFGDGLSTTTPTFMFNLFAMAKHPEIQEKVFKEISENIPKNETINVEAMNKLHLLKAVVKETFRLYPNGTEVSRITQTDMILRNYHIPTGTHVDLNQFVNFTSAKHFQEPEKFIPERWLREDQSENYNSIHPYLFVPFGHGTRMCAGRRFAEQDIYTGLTRILQAFRLELINPMESMEQVYETLLFPKNPLRLRFIKR